MSQPAVAPAPIEFALVTGGVVRGQSWSGGMDTAVLLHEPGRDLDAWADLPALLHHDGLTVIAIDLPGHGLSDDPWQPESLPDVLTSGLKVAAEHPGNVFAIAAGLCGTAALQTTGHDRLAGVVALSPLDPGETPPAKPPPPRPKLVFAGALDAAALTTTREIARQSPGWTLVSSIATTGQGNALLDSPWGAQVRDQIRTFIRNGRFGQPRR